MTRLRQALPSAAALLITAAGYWLFCPQLSDALQSSRVADWPTTVGTLESSRMVRVEFNDEDRFWVEVDYRYQVDRADYRSDRLAFGYYSSFTSSGPEKILKRLRSGDQIAVRYNPNDPGEASLSHGVSHGTRLGLAACGVAGLFVYLGLLKLLPVSERQFKLHVRVCGGLIAAYFVYAVSLGFADDSVVLDNLEIL